ncbi:hypothetical protein DV515_00003580 [Chloebia gouldiae]|uniref:Uncharacterized protein n=1 Tax=Chloebia gouldiae TaxID=44316 RepID=A0A3L8ST31_CHLGU|nr:hypothetical protein DV515_00003580 [Chloebia gouldiae]
METDLTVPQLQEGLQLKLSFPQMSESTTTKTQISTKPRATAMENFTSHSDVEARKEVWLLLCHSQILLPAEGKVSQRRELCQNLQSTKPQLP